MPFTQTAFTQNLIPSTPYHHGKQARTSHLGIGFGLITHRIVLWMTIDIEYVENMELIGAKAAPEGVATHIMCVCEGEGGDIRL